MVRLFACFGKSSIRGDCNPRFITHIGLNRNLGLDFSCLVTVSMDTVSMELQRAESPAGHYSGLKIASANFTIKREFHKFVPVAGVAKVIREHLHAVCS